ncbi:hypothetical protein SAMN02745116_02619 [Pilibacter termitis]|uniref:Phage tail assembly chaperone protein, TAC n=1 Tax=Pilibacter termitis TaxID=263852 RepID=A0A1T4RJ49_9ENTE|nr:DUF6096 family protein [Pilibacter termitis]SKA15778.1 hypothetical protein SAMN02745116_02619 [Pilibacter termitis]
MKTTQIKIGTLEFEARLAGKDYIPLEKRLKKSLFNTIMGYKVDDENLNLPTLGEMTVILSQVCKTPNVRERDIANAVENYMENGGTSYELYGQIMELLSDSGFFGKTEESGTSSEDEQVENLI